MVTGGLGFIGSHLVAALLARGCTVNVIDDCSTGVRDNLPRRAKGLRVLSADILDTSKVLDAAGGVDAAVHLAAVVGVRGSGPGGRIREVNVDGTRSVLDACSSRGVRRFILASSLAVYGERPHPGRDDLGSGPVSEYGASKLGAEALCRKSASEDKISSTALRLANVYGPRMRTRGEASVMAEFAKSVVQETPLRIFGDGRQSRDFVHVTDVVRAMVAAIQRSSAGFAAVDVGTGTAVSINRLASLFIRSSRKKLPVRHLPPTAEVRRCVADTRLAESLLGFRAEVPLPRGVREAIDWYAGIQRLRAGRPATAS